ncbi:uncharacterized protein DS421_9g276470 [Arachis hypogaea]|nr:uncharacterized protein DS421_9g276470 [Arachis hypogaea]
MSRSPIMPCKRGSSPWTCFAMPGMGQKLQTAALEEQPPNRLRTLHGYRLVPRSAEKLLRTNHHDSTIHLLSFFLILMLASSVNVDISLQSNPSLQPYACTL